MRKRINRAVHLTAQRCRTGTPGTFLVAGSLLVILGVTLGLSGCVSPPPAGPVRGLHEVTEDKIRTAIDDGRYAQAFQDLVLHGEKGTVDTDTVEQLRSRAAEELMSSYRGALEDESYDRALLLHRIAAEAGFEDELTAVLKNSDGENNENPGEAEGKETRNGSGTAEQSEENSDQRKGRMETLRALRVLKAARSGSAVPAFALLRRMDSLDVFTDDQLEVLMKAAFTEQKRTALRTLLEEAGERELEVEDEHREMADRPHSQGELIRGTVTIWVNRGMRIEEGVGRPDRVIGSGFYIDKRGYIITNYHVIKSEVDPTYEGYSRLFIRPSEDSKEKIPARVIGWDPVFDLALLKVETEAEMVLSFSAHQEVEPGERIYAIGSPAGLENTITSGIVSAVGRRFLQLGNVIQVDVPINQGNSGGPLLDDEGNLIGVVFAGIEQFEGVNFAIPVKWVGYILPDLYDGKRVKHPFLGMALEETNGTLTVSYVYPGGPADEIGIRSGDILRTLGGQEVEKITAAQEVLLDYPEGALINVKWSRDGQQFLRPAAVEERPEIPLKEVLDRDQYENLFSALFGMEVERIGSSMLAPRYVVKRVYQGGIADDTGLSKNDPFTLQNWKILEEQQVVLAQIRVKKRKAGFLETGVQLGAYLETNNFL
jgi:S1-C subfamily serine protease